MSKERSCPLGHTCDKCLWHTELGRSNAQTGENWSERKCVMEWILEMNINNGRLIDSVGAAVESHREQNTANNDRLMQAIGLQAEDIEGAQGQLIP